MKLVLIVCVILIGGFFLFVDDITYHITFEQPTPPEKIIVVPPKSIDAEIVTPPPPPPQASTELPPKPTVITPPPPPPQKPLAQSSLYEKGLGATVNFLCPNKDGSYAVATGAIIDSSGYIISNAHILEIGNTQPLCTIRTGSPAVTIGKAKLVFIPAEYFATTDQQTQVRMDITLWKLEGTRHDWPFWDIDFDAISKKDETLLTQSYAAELLSNELVFKGLNLLFSNTIVSHVDASIIASRATVAAQHGSSGGILIDPYTGKLRGIIFGISTDTTKIINERVLYAITPSHINALVWQEKQKQFREYLAALPEPAY